MRKVFKKWQVYKCSCNWSNIAIGLSIKNVNEYNRCMMVTVAVMLAALANGIWKNASFGENYAAQCISVKMAQEDVFGSEKEL